MLTHDSVRRLLRPLLALVATAWLVLGALVGPASADTPSTWEKSAHVSPFSFLLVLVIFPLAAAAVISLLVVLPSMASKRGYEPGQTWRGELEWFGGPTRGVKAADEVTPDQIARASKDAGGTSGRW